MARVSNTLIGKSSGRVGNEVFSTWKGINVLKEKPASVANPNTDLQLMQRSAMRQVVIIYRAIAAVAFLGFRKLAIKQSSWNAFASENLKNAFDFSTPPTALLLAEQVLISKGSMSPTSILTTNGSVGSGTIGVTFDGTGSLPGQAVSDTVLFVAYNITRDEWAFGDLSSIRSANAMDLTVPTGWASGENCVFYLGFYSNISGSASDSVDDLITLSA